MNDSNNRQQQQGATVAVVERAIKKESLAASAAPSSTCSVNGDIEADDETQAQIDLALTTNFDPEFFDYGWADDSNNESKTTDESRERRGSETGEGGNLNRLTNMMLDHSFPQESEANIVTDSSKDSVTSSLPTKPPAVAILHPSLSTSTTTQAGATLSSYSDTSTATKTASSVTSSVHPLAIPSSAAALASTYTAQAAALAAAAAVQPGSNLISASLLPLAYNSMAAGMPNPPTASVPSAAISNAPAAAAVPQTAKAPPITGQQPENSVSLPPFLLFDAPIELRANFMACQRANGMPTTLDDNNSLHYGLAVNGYHPLQGLSEKPTATSGVKLIDGRHGDVGSKHVRNVREQKRTQKITDLIDQLRLKMERGGWKVGLKSKFHTLSSCADYVKHLVKVNKEKERALEKTKSDLEEKRRKLEEENANQQDPSDPESTTSSLTVSSGGAPAAKRCRTDAAAVTSNDEKEPLPGIASSELRSSLDSKESSLASTSDDSRKRKLGQSVAIKQMNESVSDITDSNKGSSSEGNSSGTSGQNYSGDEAASKGTVLSDAAVARGVDSHDYGPNPTDVYVKKKRKVVAANDAARKSSIEKSFELDYKEVFLKSNVPQLLATTSGRVVAWNEFFLKVTGLSEDEASRITIFSLVRSNKLSELFEIVAAALRSDEAIRTKGSNAPSESQEKEDSSQSSESTGSKWNYTAITLPCTSFRRSSSEGEVKPLYITVTLMSDEDPRKRCFHCALTDFPGTNGAMGVVTPELLSRMFTQKYEPAKSHHEPNTMKRKRTRSVGSK